MRLTALLLLATALVADEAFFPRTPCLSPDGALVVFGLDGDLWSVPFAGGRAERLTAHPAYDHSPIFSPDGQALVFASDRFGNDDLFHLPLQGGQPARLTFAASADVPQAWHDDGRIVFASRRWFPYPMSTQLWQLPASGGTPSPFVGTFANAVAFGPADAFVCQVGGWRLGRKGYRGSAQPDLWLFRADEPPRQLTTHRGVDSHPMWGDDGRIYWLNDQDGVFNLWSMAADGSDLRQLSFFAEDGARNARMSRNGQRIVLEAGMGLHTWQRGQKGTRPMAIDVLRDALENPQIVEAASSASELSSAGDELALVVRGEIALLHRELGGSARLLQPHAAREEGIAFRPGRPDTLVLVTDRDPALATRFGRPRIALCVPADTASETLRKARHTRLLYLTSAERSCHSPGWSPDGQWLAYLEGKGDLRIMRADGSEDRLLAAHWSQADFAWSPDSRYLAYAQEDRHYNSDIWLLPIDGSAPALNLSRHPDDDTRPVWSPDGRQLAWSTRRHENQADVYAVYLRSEDHQRSREQWREWDTTGGPEPDSLHVVVDADELYLRTRRLSSLPGDEFPVAFTADAQRLVFSAEVDGQRDLFSVDRFGRDRKRVTSGGTNPRDVEVDALGKELVFLSGGRPAWLPLAGGKLEKASFSARLTISRQGERLQILDEAVRRLGESFYDPAMHGADWPRLQGIYRERVARVGCERDYADLLNMLLGELNSSHQGYRGPSSRSPYGSSGYLGLRFDAQAVDGGLRVAEVLSDGPADTETGRLVPGDVLLRIDGSPVDASHNVFEPLQGKAGMPVLVELRRAADTLELELEPVDGGRIRQLAYREMERVRSARVTEASAGRLAYIHIQGMGQPQLEDFERDLYAQAEGREALLIDVRDNGGGWTTDMLLTILTQPVHAYTIGRDGQPGYPQPRFPLYRWERPVVVLCNQNSFSNAEIFSWAIQTTGRGTVVGTETAGGVISTGGWSTLNGGSFRLPFRGWYVYGSGTNMEHNGCVPDVSVPYTPGDGLRGVDPQLEEAIRLAIEAADALEADPETGR